MARTWTDEQLIEAVKSSDRLSAVIIKLGLNTIGSNYTTIKRHIIRLNLNTNHFLSTNEQRVETVRKNSKLTLNDIFSQDGKVSRACVKKTILKLNLLPYKCSRCTIDTWQEEKLTLQLDHINGVNNDNRLENLRFLCPNCHSLTPNYCGGNTKGKGHKKNCLSNDPPPPIKKILDNKCFICKANISEYSTFCKKCASSLNEQNQPVISWIPIEELIELCKSASFIQVGKKLGVSDNAVRKHLRKYGIDPKSIKNR